MNNNTHSVVIDAPKSAVFTFLSQPENLPKWAIHFCKSIERVDGEHYVESPMGRLLFRLGADEATGVIDSWAGPNADQLGYFPSRVLDLGQGKSLYTMTTLQTPDMSDEQYEGMCASLSEEFAALRQCLEAEPCGN